MQKRELKLLAAIITGFAVLYFLPSESEWFQTSILSAFNLVSEYAKEHVLTCLIPAFFIAGGIAVFIKKEAILKFLGHDAKKIISYPIASISGLVLAVCSCTILPLFAGIRKRGAGLGPAVAFLFSGPAINIGAIFLTMSVLGFEIGIARIFFSILLAILTGLTMALIFNEKSEKGKLFFQESENVNISKITLIFFFGLLLGIIIINGLNISTFVRHSFTLIFVVLIFLVIYLKLGRENTKKWLGETWGFSKTLIPLLFIGVFAAGFIMPLIPDEIIVNLVGSNTLLGNLIASVFGAFMYFSTLTEIPILEGFMAKGMHDGPALALLLGGPSLSIPNMLVIRKILGNKKTAAYIILVVAYSTIAGFIFGMFS